jgi:hypothetical protein
MQTPNCGYADTKQWLYRHQIVVMQKPNSGYADTKSADFFFQMKIFPKLSADIFRIIKLKKNVYSLDM